MVINDRKRQFIQLESNESIALVNKTCCFHIHSLFVFFSFCLTVIHVTTPYDINLFVEKWYVVLIMLSLRVQFIKVSSLVVNTLRVRIRKAFYSVDVRKEG